MLASTRARISSGSIRWTATSSQTASSIRSKHASRRATSFARTSSPSSVNCCEPSVLAASAVRHGLAPQDRRPLRRACRWRGRVRAFPHVLKTPRLPSASRATRREMEPGTDTHSEVHDGVERQHPGVTFAVLALGGVSYALLQSLVAPALPDIQHALHTSEASVSWVLTSYLLSASIATPIIGRLGDIHGKERLLVIVLALLAVGTLLSALATTLTLMLVGRIVQGAAGGIFPLAFGIIRDEFPREQVAARIGLMSALLGVGGGAGVVLAGPIVDHLSYHYLFWLPLIPIVIATVATQVVVPESPVR